MAQRAGEWVVDPSEIVVDPDEIIVGADELVVDPSELSRPVRTAPRFAEPRMLPSHGPAAAASAIPSPRRRSLVAPADDPTVESVVPRWLAERGTPAPPALPSRPAPFSMEQPLEAAPTVLDTLRQGITSGVIGGTARPIGTMLEANAADPIDARVGRFMRRTSDAYLQNVAGQQQAAYGDDQWTDPRFYANIVGQGAGSIAGLSFAGGRGAATLAEASTEAANTYAELVPAIERGEMTRAEAAARAAGVLTWNLAVLTGTNRAIFEPVGQLFTRMAKGGAIEAGQEVLQGAGSNLATGEDLTAGAAESAVGGLIPGATMAGTTGHRSRSVNQMPAPVATPTAVPTAVPTPPPTRPAAPRATPGPGLRGYLAADAAIQADRRSAVPIAVAPEVVVDSADIMATAVPSEIANVITPGATLEAPADLDAVSPSTTSRQTNKQPVPGQAPGPVSPGVFSSDVFVDPQTLEPLGPASTEGGTPIDESTTPAGKPESRSTLEPSAVPPVAPTAETLDRNEFGETQPRLPGAERARDDAARPEPQFEPPFSLQAENAPRPVAAQTDLFGQEAEGTAPKPPAPDEAAAVRARANAKVATDGPALTDEYLRRFGPVLNADNASELFEDYARDNDSRARHMVAVRPAAGAVVEQAFAQLLAQPTPVGKSPVVVFTAGGNGAGKSSSVDTKAFRGEVVFDSTFSQYEPSKARVQAALDAGRDVQIRYIYRDPVQAFAKGVLPRIADENGRTVSIRGLLQTHRGARDTVLKIADEYRDDPRVDVWVREMVEGEGPESRDLAWLQEKAYPDDNATGRRLQELLDAEHAAGRVSDAAYRATHLPGGTRSDSARDGRDLAPEHQGVDGPTSGPRRQSDVAPASSQSSETPQEKPVRTGDPLVDGARAAGYTGPDAALRKAYHTMASRAADARDTAESEGARPADLFRALARYGGIGRDAGFTGEIDRLWEFSGKGQRARTAIPTGRVSKKTGRAIVGKLHHRLPTGDLGGVGRVLKNDGTGLSLDALAEALRQEPQYRDIAGPNELLAAIEQALTDVRDGRGEVASFRPTGAWWRPLINDDGTERSTRSPRGNDDEDVQAMPSPRASRLNPGHGLQLPTPQSAQKTLNVTAPPTPQRAMRPSAIIREVAEALGNDVPVSTGRFMQRALGIFKPKARAIRLKTANDLYVFFHEEGHNLDKLLNIKLKDPRFSKELIALGNATSPPSADNTYRRKEGVAEFTRLWLTDPSAAQQAAPQFFAEFERVLNGSTFGPKLRRARQTILGYLAQPLDVRGGMRIDWDGSTPGWFRLAAENPRDAILQMKGWIVDDLAPLQAAVSLLNDKSGKVAPAAADAYVLARLARGAGAKAEAFLRHGVRNDAGQFTGPSLADAIRPVKDTLQEFGTYLVALRVLEKRGQGFETGISLEEAQAIITTAQQRPDFSTFERARDNVYAYQDAVLQYAVDKDVLSAKQAAKIRAKNQFYVPFKRVADHVDALSRSTGKRLANRVSPIKRFKGSGRDIINPFEGIVANTVAIVDAVEKNAAMVALAKQVDDTTGSAQIMERVPVLEAERISLGRVLDALDPKGDARDAIEQAGFDPDTFLTLFKTSLTPRPNEHIVTVLRKGVPEHYQVHSDQLYQAITVIGPQQVSKLLEWATKPVDVLRSAVTLTPGYIARNPLRDTFVAAIQSRYGFVPVVDTVRGLLSQVLNDEDARLFWTSGVAQAALTNSNQDRDRARQFVRGLGESKGKFLRRVARNPLEAMRALSEMMEVATRLGEFKLALDAGGRERRVGALGIAQRAGDRLSALPSARAATRQANRQDPNTLTAAALAARDVTTDFSRGGNVSREVSRYVAFFNARVQGYLRMGETVSRDPMGTLLSVGAMAALSYALWWWNHDDEDEGRAFNERIPPEERNTYWHIRMPSGGYLKFAKPFEWGYVPNLVEAALDYMQEKDAAAFARIRPDSDAALQSAVELIPTGVAPLLEAYFNYDSFRRADIVPEWDTDLDVALQYSDWTSDTAKWLGPVVGVAPAKIDHILYGYTVNMGRAATEYLADPLVRALQGTEKAPAPSKQVQQWPVVGVFYRDDAASSRADSVTEFYRRYREMQGFERSYKRWLLENPTHAKTRQADAAREPWFRDPKGWDRAAKDLRDLRKRIDAIYAAPRSAMSPAQKREALTAIRSQMVAITRQALGKTPALPSARRPSEPAAATARP